MKIIYQGVPCLYGEMNRAPGLGANRGFVYILRELIGDLTVKYSPLGWIQGQAARWPEGERTETPFSFGGTPPGDAASAQQGGGAQLNFVGDLVFDSSDMEGGSGSNVRTFNRIYVDRTGLEEDTIDAFDDGGRVAVVKINLIDSRYLWPLSGEVTGNFNILAPGGGFDGYYLREQIVGWRYEALLRMAVRALPTSPVLTFVHSDVSGTADPVGEKPDHELPISFLSRMLDHGQFTICLHDDDTVGIYRENVDHAPFSFREKGDGAAFSIPPSEAHSFVDNVSYVPRPGVVRVIGDYRRQNKSSPMTPVFTDKRGKLRPLTDKALSDAQMTIAGVPVTLELLQSWIMARPQNVKKLEPEEEKILQDAYRLYMISSAGSPETDAVRSWDFSKSTHPFLPVLPRLAPPDETSSIPYEAPPRVTAVTYKQRMFKDKASLEDALKKYVDYIDQESAKFLEFQLAAEKNILDLLSRFKSLVAANESRTNSIISGAEAGVTFTEAFVDITKAGVIYNLFDKSSKDTERSPDAFTKLANAFSFKKQMYEQEAQLYANHIANNSARKVEVESNKQKILDNHEFREFFRRHFLIGQDEVPTGAYDLIPEQGLVRFHEPMFIPKALVVQDLDASSALPPEDAHVSISYSYQFKGEAGMARVSWLFVNDPGNAGAPKMVGKNSLCDVAPYPVMNPELLEWLNEDGSSISSAFDDSMEAAAEGMISKLFFGQRSSPGRTYSFTHFWRVAAIPPVTNIVVGTSGDDPRTYVAVNNPEVPLLGYASRRQNEEAVNNVIRAELKATEVFRRTTYFKSK